LGSPDRKKLIQKYYSARAKDYDGQKSRTWKTASGFGDEALDELLGALKGLGGRLLLEAGVGSGRNALPILERIGPRFVGLDLSREMLERTREKLSPFSKSCDLVLGDAEYLPFVAESFDALVCMSTMHYFDHQDKIMKGFSVVIKEKGVFIYGDLTVHESDDEGFFERLERTVSKAHAGYCKPSEARKLLETCGFRVSRVNTFAYRKLHRSLMEDKGVYFGVPPEALEECLHSASAKSRKLYGLTDTELTLYYTVIAANKQSQ